VEDHATGRESTDQGSARRFFRKRGWPLSRVLLRILAFFADKAFAAVAVV
jgi:hypothetical protein